jgi:hypothetical protein
MDSQKIMEVYLLGNFVEGDHCEEILVLVLLLIG